MKKLVITLACMLICLSLFSGCGYDKDNGNSGADSGTSVNGDVDIDAEAKGDTDNLTGNDGIVYDLKNPENADGIVITPKK